MIEHLYKTEIGTAQLPEMVRRAVLSKRPFTVITPKSILESRKKEVKRALPSIPVQFATPHEIRSGLRLNSLILVDDLSLSDPRGKLLTYFAATDSPVWMRVRWGVEELRMGCANVQAGPARALARMTWAERVLRLQEQSRRFSYR